ncbi:MAG: type II toxin-antitoxin system prevent-host-death family antitoxin [Deltaproteobacteria bacterium]|nr:type II toxin-antitoxin system prevent-host-death family antitoxin [Deltaproteobacteria bacterium]
MRAISYTAARNNLATTIKKVCDDHDPIIVTRKNEDSVIIISLEDYESLQETAYLSQSPKNIKRLLESIEQLESGKGIKKELLK